MRAIFFALVLAVPAPAQETRALPAGAASPPARIEQLAWLEGTWRGAALGGTAIEVYSAPDAGQITGHFTQTKNGKVAFYELMQVVPAGKSLVYRLRHFNADLSGWEDANPKKTVDFALVGIQADAVHFDGMTFRRTGPDAMTVWVRIDDEGKTREEPFRYRRIAHVMR